MYTQFQVKDSEQSKYEISDEYPCRVANRIVYIYYPMETDQLIYQELPQLRT